MGSTSRSGTRCTLMQWLGLMRTCRWDTTGNPRWTTRYQWKNTAQTGNRHTRRHSYTSPLGSSRRSWWRCRTTRGCRGSQRSYQRRCHTFPRRTHRYRPLLQASHRSAPTCQRGSRYTARTMCCRCLWCTGLAGSTSSPVWSRACGGQHTARLTVHSPQQRVGNPRASTAQRGTQRPAQAKARPA